MKLTSDEIRILLIEKLTGTITADDALMVDQMLAEDPAVAMQYAEMQLSLAAGKVQATADADLAWQQLHTQIIPKHRSFVPFMRYAIAACLTGVLAIGAYKQVERKERVKPIAAALPHSDRLYLQTGDKRVFYLDSAATSLLPQGVSLLTSPGNLLRFEKNAQVPESWNTLSVPRVLDYRLQLSDGTEVLMNSRSTLRFPAGFSGKQREVYLTGEAFFKVAKDPAHPFIVHASNTAITVLGTSFNLNAYDTSRVNTSLLEGAVTASMMAETVHLEPGMQAALDKGIFHVSPFDSTEVLSWTKGVHYFRNSSLEELSKLLTRWYDVDIHFENEAARSKTFSGEIAKNQPVQLFLENLRLSNNIQLQFSQRLITFR